MDESKEFSINIEGSGNPSELVTNPGENQTIPTDNQSEHSSYADPKTGLRYYFDPESKSYYQILPGSGKKIFSMEGGSGTILDPEPADLATEAASRGAFEARLRGLEEQAEPISTEALRDFRTTISEKFINFPTNPNFRLELMAELSARVKYHNTAIKAKENAKEYGAEFGTITNKEHETIFNIAGVREVLRALAHNNGEYFRLPKPAADALAAPGGGYELALLGAGVVTTPKEAQRAIDLALKANHIFGDSGYYDGIRTATGPKFFIGPNAKGESAEQQYADFFAKEWDKIQFGVNGPPPTGSLSGVGAGAIKDILYLPIRLQKNSTGVSGLRKLAYLRISMGGRSANPAGFISVADIAGTPGVTPISTDAIDQTKGWAKSIGGIGENGEKLWKGGESVLEAPLGGANGVNLDNERSTLGDVLKTYEAASAAFGHLRGEPRKKAMSDLLKGLMVFHNSGRAVKDGLDFKKWGSDIVNEVVSIEIEKGNIDKSGADDVRRELGAWIPKAIVEIGMHESSKGATGYATDVLKAILGIGGGRR